MRKAVVRISDGYVENIVEWEPGTPWRPPEGTTLVDAERDGSPGDTWDGTKFVKPFLSPPPEDWRSEWAKATTTAAKLSLIAKYLGWV